MQLRTIDLILLVLAVVASRAESIEPDVLKRNLLELSGLKEGPIELIEGNEDCIASSLRILEIDEDDHFTLTISLGATPLITTLGVANDKYTERGCAIVEAATVGNKKVGYTKTQDCKAKGKFEYKTDVLVTSSGFEYTKVNKDLVKKIETLRRTCKYKFAQ